MPTDVSNKNFSDMEKGLESGATIHEAVTAGTGKTFTVADAPRAIYVATDGNLVIKDWTGTAVTVTYAVKAGDVLPFTPSEIVDTTTANIVLWW
jgi:hypothetical protein